MKKSYITVLSSEEYTNGVLVLNKSLLNQKCKYPLTVLINKGICNDKIISLLRKNKINFIIKDININLPDNIIQTNMDQGFNNWNKTFEKLFIFELTEFDKIVYIDSDMFILENIDELFEKEHMSAVVSGRKFNSNWTSLNSGCMVICPQDDIVNQFIDIIYELSNEKTAFGDQDVLQKFYHSWEKNKELHLGEKYNMFLSNIDYYIKNLDYTLDSLDRNRTKIAIVHFVGKYKPWQRKYILFYLNLFIKFRFNAIMISYKYRKILKSIIR